MTHKLLKLYPVIFVFIAINAMTFSCAEMADYTEAPQFISSITECGDELYAMGTDGITLYKRETDSSYIAYERSARDFVWVGSLMEYNNQLYCLGHSDNSIWLYEIDCAGQFWTVDAGLKILTDLSSEAVISSGICGDVLAILIRGEGADEFALFNMSGEKMDHYSFDNKIHSVAYGSDFIIAQAFEEKEGVYSLRFLDLLTCEEQVLQENPEPISLMCVDGKQNLLYYQRSSSNLLLCAPISDPDTEKQVATISEEGILCCYAMDDCIITGGAYGIFTHSTKESDDFNTLTIGYTSSNLNMGITQQQLASYTKDRADLQITMTEMSDREIMESLLYGSPTPDIFVLTSDSQAFSSMASRGYYVDLQSSDQIMQDFETLDPRMKAFMLDDGAVIGIPLGIEATEVMYQASKLQQATTRNIDTWNALFAFMASYPEIKKDGLEGIILYASLEPDVQILMRVTQWYYQKERYQNGVVNFEDEAFISLVEAYQKIPFDEIRAADSISIASGQVDKIFEFDFPYTLAGGSNMEILKLSDHADMDYPSFARISLVMLNPFSPQQKEGVRFLEHLSQTRIVGMEVALKPHYSEPIRSSNADDIILQFQKEQAELLERLSIVDPIERPEIENQLEEIERSMQAFEEGWAWIVSPDMLNSWRAYCEDLQIVSYNGIFDNPDAISSVRNLALQLIDNHITAAQFAQKLDAMFYLQQKEGY